MTQPKGRQRKVREPKKVTRYSHEGVTDPGTPETGHTPLLPAEEQVVTLPMDNGWSKAIDVGRLSDDGLPVLVDVDPAYDPLLFWAGKRNRREVPVLPLQRNEVIAESRIARIIERARTAARAKTTQEPEQTVLFADLEKALRETEKDKRVEFYTHEEGWKNKLICGDSLQVMESLIRYENLRGKVQMIYIDPPYGVKYDANFQQRIDSTKNESRDEADDVLTIKAYRDTWALGIHSYLSYLGERLYLCRELLADTGSVFVQMGEDHLHLVRSLLDEVFGKANYLSEIVFFKTSGKSGAGLDAIYDTLLWYAKDKNSVRYRQLYRPRPPHTLVEQYTLVELANGTVRRITHEELAGNVPLPDGARRFMPDQISSQGESSGGAEPFIYEGVPYSLPPNTHWKTSREGLERLRDQGRLYPIGKRLRYRRYALDFPLAPYSNVWEDTVISGFGAAKLYAVQTSPKVVERCILMSTNPGDLVLDPTCGSGTTAACSEKLGRRWITCDTSRVAINVARQRLLSAVFDHYRTRNGSPASGFEYQSVERVTLKSLAYGLEPEKVELVDRPLVDPHAIRITGPFEVMTLGRYAPEDWKGYIVAGNGEAPRLENYIAVICRLYRKGAGLQGSAGTIHAVVELDQERLGISVGPISGRVTARQIYEAVRDANASGLTAVHVLGWAFEANVGEEKARLEAESSVRVQLVMIRPDTLAEGLRITQPQALFSPLALPDVAVESKGNGLVRVTLKGVAVFDRKRHTTDYKVADSGYVAAWYLDEDYDGDCFVDCQMFFDFKKQPAIERTLGITIDPDDWTLRLDSDPFKPGKYRRVAAKVVDVYGNESTTVQNLKKA
jgi:adenine-specific DNA-methyltransferase